MLWTQREPQQEIKYQVRTVFFSYKENIKGCLEANSDDVQGGTEVRSAVTAQGKLQIGLNQHFTWCKTMVTDERTKCKEEIKKPCPFLRYPWRKLIPPKEN